MGIHNVDEILWLSGRAPRSAIVVGSRIYSYRLTQCTEDFDDAILLLDFDGTPGDEMVGEVQVGRNEVLVEVYGRPNSASPVSSRSFPLHAYSDPLPEFANRFGAAYREELHIFIQCCLNGSSFPTTHLDGLRAQEVIEAGMSAILAKDNMAEIHYGHLPPRRQNLYVKTR